MGENRNLRASLQHLIVLNGVLREFIHQHSGCGGFMQKTGNSWNNNFNFDRRPG
jgi:hypothetical protein